MSSIVVRSKNLEKEEEEQQWEVRNTENGEVCSIQAQDFRSLRRKIQDVYGTSTAAVRVFYLNDECDVVFVKRNQDLEDALFVLPKKDNKMVTAVKSHQEIENRVDDDDDEEKASDESTDDDSVSENPQKRLKEQQKREKKIEMLSKRDEKLADQINVLEEKIVALQRRKEQLTENKTQVRENLVDLKSQEKSEVVVAIKQEEENIEEAELSDETVQEEEEEEEEEEKEDCGKPRSFGQLRKLQNQQRNIERRLCNLEAKEKKSKKMMETEIILKRRLEEITERLALTEVEEQSEEQKDEKFFMNKRKGKDGHCKHSRYSHGSPKKNYSPPKEKRWK